MKAPDAQRAERGHPGVPAPFLNPACDYASLENFLMAGVDAKPRSTITAPTA